MNQVDAGHRTEFRELFELNFARFDATLQHGLGELRADFRESLSGMRAELREELGGVRQSLVEMKGDLRTEIAASRAESLRWNILMWIGAVGTMVALVKL